METQQNNEDLIGSLIEKLEKLGNEGSIMLEGYLEKGNIKKNIYYLYFRPLNEFHINSMNTYLPLHQYQKTNSEFCWKKQLNENEEISNVKIQFKGIKKMYLLTGKLYIFYYSGGELIFEEII